MPWFTPASGKSGTLVNHHKTELLEEITKQFSLGTDNLMEDDKKYLLKCSITDLATTNGEQPEYGLLTSHIRAALQQGQGRQAFFTNKQSNSSVFGYSR